MPFNSNNDIARQASASRMATDMQELREISASTASQWADAKAELVALVTNLTRLSETMHDHDVIMENQRATIRAFAHDADSILTSSLMEPTQTASFQVSTLNVNSTRSASFMTAWTSAATGKAAEGRAVYPRQLLVHGIGSGTIVIRRFEYESQFRYGHQLMVAVESRISVPTTFFWLAYGGKIIREDTDMAQIPDNATICAHYRAIRSRAFKIDVEVPDGPTTAIISLDTTTEHTVADLKAQIKTRTKVPVEDQTLHFECWQEGVWSQLQDDRTLLSYSIYEERLVRMMSRATPDRVKQLAKVDEEELYDEDDIEWEVDLTTGHFGSYRLKRKSHTVVQGGLWGRVSRLTWKRPNRWSGKV
jgi:hypothetical protein